MVGQTTRDINPGDQREQLNRVIYSIICTASVKIKGETFKVEKGEIRGLSFNDNEIFIAPFSSKVKGENSTNVSPVGSNFPF